MENGTNGSGTKLQYANTPVHRVVKDAWIQAGDIVDGTGANSVSVYGSVFEDESYSVQFDGPGILAMANTGPHTNGSQFFITLQAMPLFSGKKVGFGKVLGGMDVIQQINTAPVANQRPTPTVTIRGGGEHIPPKVEKKVVKAPVAEIKKKTTIVMIGLDGAGKSTIANHYKLDPTADVVPTNGFELETCERSGHKVSIFGLGGNKSIRGYWDQYYDEAMGVVFVVDAGDRARSLTSCDELIKAMKHPLIQGKPVMLYLNKQDTSNPLSATELEMEIVTDLQGSKSPFSILTTTAIVTDPLAPETDENIFEGLDWLLRRVDDRRDALEARVSKDVAERKARSKAERAAKAKAK